MTAAVKYVLALTAYELHAQHCPACELPSLDRFAGCQRGRELDQTFVTAWRARVDALTEGRL